VLIKVADRQEPQSAAGRRLLDRVRAGPAPRPPGRAPGRGAALPGVGAPICDPRGAPWAPRGMP
ncbi:hypothetical protein, partial [Actinomadura napierensis]|uniref:hypothetical protein n=1 Tax=Actinomadura napierensis TaxID=267854 RepID=UPI0031E2638A